jgi:histidinol-phosphate aminotransferase
MSEPMHLSRRSFFRVSGAIAGAVVAAPILTEAQLALAQVPKRREHSAIEMVFPPDAVLINANENPLGPSPAALEAITRSAVKGGRYEHSFTAELTQTFAEQEGLKPESIAVYAGSSEPLHYSSLAFCSPQHSYVFADPTFESGPRAAELAGAKTIGVPLTKNYAHDVKAMVAADPNAGLIYICNPNNPTGTLTSKADIVWALEHKPKSAILLIDEAYIHLSDAESCIDLVKADKDVIVLRTFSKIYGMAGIRCGFALARPDLLDKLRAYGMNSMPITAAAAATACLKDPSLVPARKKIIAGIRNETFAWLAANNFSFIPSQSNCFMIDTKRDGKAVINAMAEKKIYIGRTWPVWPSSVRITVGTKEEMAKFQTAFKEVMNSPLKAANGPAPELRHQPAWFLS